MEAGLSRRYAQELQRPILPGGNARGLSATGGASGDSGRLAAQASLTGSLFYGGGLEGEGLRPRLHSRSSTALACELREHKVRTDSVRMEKSIRELSEEDGIPFYFATPGISEDGSRRLDDSDSHVVAERGSRSHLQRFLLGRRTAIFHHGDHRSNSSGPPEMASRGRGIRWHAGCSGKSGRRRLRLPRRHARSSTPPAPASSPQPSNSNDHQSDHP